MSRKGQRGKCSLIGFTSQLPVWICAPFLLGATKMEPITLNEKLSLDINKCIRTLVMKFRECPYNFFTESDAHSYLYLTFFRYGASALKGLYISLDTKRTVLIHREYPTAFRYAQKDLELKRYKLEEHHGTVGHYDMVVLNPAFVESFDIEQVISKDNKIRMSVKYSDNLLLAAIEFKLLYKPLTEDLKDEIKKDFFKLNEALKKDDNLEKGQTKQAYMLIFNRWGREEKYWGTLEMLKIKYPNISLIYQESYYDNDGEKRMHQILS